MPPKLQNWNNAETIALIEAWHDEECLFNSKSPNYHNKHLRKQALDRVVAKVKQVKANATADSCTKKFGNLRTEFGKEHKKVLASTKSGTGTADVYTPSLWYYKHLMFIADHVQSRKSKSVGIAETDSQHDEGARQSVDDTVEVINEGFDDDGFLRLYTVDMTTQENDSETQESSSVVNTNIKLPSENPQHDGQAVKRPVESRPSTPRPDTPSASACTSKIKKRKTEDDSSYVDAMKAVASALTQEDKTADEIEAFCLNLAGIIRSIKSEEASLRLRMKLTNLAMEARLEDLAKK